MDLAVASDQVSGSFPSDEKFGMISQIRRAATSVPANGAEGLRESSLVFSRLVRYENFKCTCEFWERSMKSPE
jgi:four helix bundle protein